MSQLLHEADNLSIKGHHYQVKTYGHLPNASQPNIPSWEPHTTDPAGSEMLSDAIHLDFTLLINGKLKTFGWSFLIEKDEFEWTLMQWSDWNAIFYMLHNLGYPIGSQESFWQWVVRKWINNIMN